MNMKTITRRFVTLTFTRWFATGLSIPVLVLLGRERGLSLATIGALMTVYSVTTLVLELPTGGLADVVGRRPLLMTASAVSATTTLVVASAVSTWVWAVGLAGLGLARALDSGPLQAWFVDAAGEIEPKASVRHGLSRSSMAAALGIGAGALASGALVTFSPLPHQGEAFIALSTPLLVSATLAATNAVLAALWLTEHRNAFTSDARAILANVPVTLRHGAVLVAHHRPLRRIFALTAALGTAVASIELLAPGHFSRLFGSASDAAGPYSLLVTAGFAGSAVGSGLAPVATRLLKKPTRVIAAAGIGAAITLPFIASGSLAVACVAFVAFYLILDIGGPLVDEITHDAVSSSERATVLSMRSMSLQAAAAIVTVSMGALSTVTTIAVSLGVAGLVLSLGSLAMWRYPRPAEVQDSADSGSGTKSTPVSLR